MPNPENGQASNLMLQKEASHHPSVMGSGVVILENHTRSHCLQCGEDNAPYDLIPVPYAGEMALYEMQGVLPCKWILPTPSLTLLHGGHVGKHKHPRTTLLDAATCILWHLLVRVKRDLAVNNTLPHCYLV